MSNRLTEKQIAALPEEWKEYAYLFQRAPSSWSYQLLSALAESNEALRVTCAASVDWGISVPGMDNHTVIQYRLDFCRAEARRRLEA